MSDWFNQLLLNGETILRPDMAWLPLTVFAGGLFSQIVWRAVRTRRGVMVTTDGNSLGRLFTPGSFLMVGLAGGVAVAGLTYLSLAAINPAVPGLVPKDDSVIMQVLDKSGSMNQADAAPSGAAPVSRIGALSEASSRFALNLPEKAMSGLVTYSSEGDEEILVTPRQDRQLILEELENLKADGGTAIGNGIETGVEVIQNYFAGAGYAPELQPPGILVLLSDGARDQGTFIEDAIDTAKAANVAIYTISFGSDGSEQDPEAMEAIARETGGEHFFAANGIELNAIYDRLQKLIGYEVVMTSVADSYARWGGGMLAAACILVMLATRSPNPFTSKKSDNQQEETKWTMYAA